jgi:hypothetical protein
MGEGKDRLIQEVNLNKVKYSHVQKYHSETRMNNEYTLRTWWTGMYISHSGWVLVGGECSGEMKAEYYHCALYTCIEVEERRL